jgi:hypothetical protein
MFQKSEQEICASILITNEVGWKNWNLVDGRGFEPPASSLRTVGKIS